MWSRHSRTTTARVRTIPGTGARQNAEFLGRELRENDPVFIRLDRQLDDIEAITRDGAAQIVKRAAVRAGLDGNYASHSLRAGFVTDALDAGATREQVQRHGRWNNIRSIDPYYRKTEVWSGSTAGARARTRHQS